MNMAELWSTWPRQAPSGLRVLTILCRSAAPVGQTSGSRCSSYRPSQKAGPLIWGKSLPKAIMPLIISVTHFIYSLYFFLPQRFRLNLSTCFQNTHRDGDLNTQMPAKSSLYPTFPSVAFLFLLINMLLPPPVCPGTQMDRRDGRVKLGRPGS